MPSSRALRRALLALVVLLLVVGGLALLLRRADAPGAPPAPAQPRGSAAAPAPAPQPQPPPLLPAEPGPTLRPLPATLAAEPQATGGAFEGRVVSAESGEGVEGAELTFASAMGATSVRTEARGQFRFAPPAPGDYQLATVTAEGFLPFAPEWGQSPVHLRAVAGQRVGDIVLALTPQLQLLGRVLSPEGTPVAGAQVRLLTGRAGESALHPVADRFVSDAKGEFRVRAPEEASLEARHPDFAAGHAVIGAAARLARVVEVRLRPRAGGAQAVERSLAGVVVDAQGQGVEGARVDVRTSVRRFPQRYGDERGYQATTDAQGRFELEGVGEGSYDVTAQAAGLAPARALDVPAGSAALRLTLQPGATLVGQVRDARGGRPLPSFTLLISEQAGPLRRESVAELNVLDPTGRFRVTGVPAGTLVVEVVAPGHAPAQERVRVPEGPSAPVEVDFQLAPGARLGGTVVSRDSGRPLAGARVSVESGRGGGALSVRFDARTDASGAFTLEGLAPGEATLHVSHERHHARLLSGVPVRAEGSAPVRVELTPTKEGEEPSVELVGIGAVLSVGEDRLVVGQVLPGGGAAEVGLLPGDGILRVDGQPVTALGFTEAIQRIRGPEGSIVLLGVQRAAAAGTDAGAGPVVDVPVPRRRLMR